jgi:SAM-dependent methyltransferase
VSTPTAPAFGDVDGADPAHLVAMMDATDAWPGVAAARAWVLDRPRLDPPALVVDVGCGPGTFAAAARRRGLRTLDVDRSVAMVGAVRARHGSVPVALAEAAALPMVDGAAGLVHAERVLQWAADPGAAMAELWRVTGLGGHLAVTDTDWGSLVIDHPEVAVAEGLARAARRWIPHPFLARSLPRRLADLGAHDVESRAEAVAVVAWDPDDPAQATGPPGLPLATIAQAARPEEKEPLADGLAVLADLARAGRFFAALTLVTAVGRR